MAITAILLSIIVLMTLQNEVSGDHHQEKLPKPIEDGMSIEINGQATFHGNRYNIDLQEGTDDKPDGDIHLHLSIRFEDDNDFVKLFINSFEDGEWQKQVHYDLSWDIPYTVQILAREDHWEILIQERSFTVKYRKPKEELEKIKFVVVHGAMKVNSINFN